jgi:PhnB protein
MPSHIPEGFHTIARAASPRAIEAGGVSLYEPSVKPYGDLVGGVRDPSGNYWYIATRQEQV